MEYLSGFRDTGYNREAGHIDPRLLRLDLYPLQPWPPTYSVSPSLIDINSSVSSNTLVPQVSMETANVSPGTPEPAYQGQPLDTAHDGHATKFLDHPDDWDAMNSPRLSDRRGSTTSASLGPASFVSDMSPASYHHSPDATTLFSCDVCHRAGIKSFGELNKHRKNHSRPICCPECGKGCPTRKDLARHRDVNHKSKDERVRYRCSHPGCSKGFTREDNCKRHMKKKHGGIDRSC
ncbi:hypothetical protein GGTG_08863 [Gaeumannomyces tritici R3-111a-1]|uniref:C2H2-type domain-containing protein n=1 Tax=Gaeumannomyces tritici (strain R3-111a-1) TaxID=644352 RepID=J3P5S3_GAET3|nr:hypothetical protein GGTG_08863 [Gaeumannomyces tritici R3-111a-1]EJT75025.1 hypothetical protein GGTG_08863 [Gaeumannomyces tritici R3-111a-1]